MSRELSGHVGAPHTPAGTFSLALARISWRSVGNSEIVLVATVATGRALRRVASVWTPSSWAQRTALAGMTPPPLVRAAVDRQLP